MKELKVRGLILREAPLGDKDKRLIMFTREMGKIPVLAKGALSPKSKWGASSQIFCYGDYVLSKGQTFYYIKEVQLIETFFEIRKNLERLAYSTLMLEVAETLCLDGLENQNLMRLLLRGLLAMSRAEEGKECLVSDAFIWRALAENGFYPELASCRVCGKSPEALPQSGNQRTKGLQEMPAEPEAVFDFSHGGIICKHCAALGAEGSGNGVRLSAGALRALRYIVEAPEEKVFSFTAQEPVQKQLDEAATGYLLQQTEKRYGSLDFIGNLRQ